MRLGSGAVHCLDNDDTCGMNGLLTVRVPQQLANAGVYNA